MGSRLVLGTAAFGSDYGVRRDGQPTPRQVEKILALARQAGIDMVDTAPAYGCECDFEGFNVVTKTPWDGSYCYAVLVHTPDDLSELPELIESDVKAGVSVYTPEQLEAALEYDIDIVQFPLSIVDGRFLPYLKTLRRRGIKSHARSVFLQGALLMPTPGLPRLDVPTCLGYVLGQDVDRVVVGVNNIAQLIEIVGTKALQIAAMPVEDESLIDPRCWR